MARILSIGDCNTLGVGDCEYDAYPERLGRLLDLPVTNCGVTMATTREGRRIWEDHEDEPIDVVTIQFGLVDSWKTIRHAPYVLYYPDNPLRKLGRKLAKKYKKLSRRLGLRRLLGEDNLVSLEEYTRNIEAIVSAVRVPCILIDTLPNHQVERNPEIERYNAALDRICAGRPHCARLRVYDYFLDHMDTHYVDETHINARGHQKIAEDLQRIMDGLEQHGQASA